MISSFPGEEEREVKTVQAEGIASTNIWSCEEHSMSQDQKTYMSKKQLIWGRQDKTENINCAQIGFLMS